MYTMYPLQTSIFKLQKNKLFCNGIIEKVHSRLIFFMFLGVLYCWKFLLKESIVRRISRTIATQSFYLWDSLNFVDFLMTHSGYLNWRNTLRIIFPILVSLFLGEFWKAGQENSTYSLFLFVIEDSSISKRMLGGKHKNVSIR